MLKSILKWVWEEGRLHWVLPALAAVAYLIHHLPGMDHMIFTAEVDALREVSLGLIVMAFALWAFRPVIERLVGERSSDLARAAWILGWFVFLHALLNFLAMTMYT